MGTPSTAMRDLARRLLDVSHTASNRQVPEPPQVVEKLRVSLTRLAGKEGFTSLLRRALLLASSEVPVLQSVTVGPDGRLQGFEELTLDADTGADGEAAVAITAHLLALLVTFIGEPLTLRLAQEASSNTVVPE